MGGGLTASFAVLSFVGVLVAIEVFRHLMSRQMLEAQQAEFDDFAAGRTGALSMLGRLDHLGAIPPPAAGIYHRWTGIGQGDRKWSRHFKSGEE